MTRQRMIRKKVSRSPGKPRAMNRALIEMVPPVASEYSTALWLRGTSSARTQEGVGRVGGESPGMAVLLHLRDHHRADRRRVRYRRAGNAAQECRCQHVDDGQAAA